MPGRNQSSTSRALVAGSMCCLAERSSRLG
jgi:hypothetical protein